MTDRSARALANGILGAAVVAAGWYVFRTPALRRLAWGLARTALTVGIPAYLTRETQAAWHESADRPAG